MLCRDKMAPSTCLHSDLRVSSASGVVINACHLSKPPSLPSSDVATQAEPSTMCGTVCSLPTPSRAAYGQDHPLRALYNAVAVISPSHTGSQGWLYVNNTALGLPDKRGPSHQIQGRPIGSEGPLRVELISKFWERSRRIIL